MLIGQPIREIEVEPLEMPEPLQPKEEPVEQPPDSIPEKQPEEEPVS